jgi:hypothetical protein
MNAYNYVGWIIYWYEGVASWCYDGFVVTWHQFTQTGGGQLGWNLSSQYLPRPTHADGGYGGNYFWWSRYAQGHFKNCQYGICLTGDLWVRQAVYGDNKWDQSGG